MAEAVTAPILKKIDRIIVTDLQRKPAAKQEEQETSNELEKQQPLKLIITLLKDPVQQEVKGESAMLQLLMDYISSPDASQFVFVADEVSTKSPSRHCWLVQSLLLASSQSAR